MADAKKCDRCGKYYEKNEEHKYTEEMQHKSMIAARIQIRSVSGFMLTDYDMCDECLSRFKEFMDGDTKDEDDCKGAEDDCKDAESEQVGTIVKRTNMTVGQLKNVLSLLPNHMDVIIPAIDPLDANKFDGFQPVRTAGVLSCEHERDDALCLNTSDDGLDISGQIRYNKLTDITCKRVMF